MASTASTEKALNWYLGDKGIHNSGISTFICTNTGNKKMKYGKHFINDTYTLSSTGRQAEINADLLDYDEKVMKTGVQVDATLAKYDWVQVYGHPDKWLYDYHQEYNNCGVNSCLNMLSVAGVKDIVEVTPGYEAYLSTPQYKTTKKVVWNSEEGKWETQEITEAHYPNAPKVETEDSFLLWAVQNSKNDEESYLQQYDPDYDKPMVEKYHDSFCIHAENAEYYKTIQDLKDHILEVGGTYAWQQENILDYWGVEATTGYERVRPVLNVVVDDIVNKSAPAYEILEDGNRKVTEVTTTISYDRTCCEKTTVTETKIYYETYVPPKEGETEGTWEKVDEDYYLKEESTTVTIIEYVLNHEKYNFALDLHGGVKYGQGMNISGFANAFLNEKGGSHAISLVGSVEVDDAVRSVKTVSTTYDGKTTVKDPEYVHEPDVVGFYVIDTGGFLNPSVKETAQYVPIEMFYNFWTDTYYVDNTDKTQVILNFNPDTYYDKGANPNQNIVADLSCMLTVSDDCIKDWADDLNLIGNHKKNILSGNNSRNTIKAGKSNDVLYGEGGNDKLYGEADKDTLYGGAGDDTLYGGSGDDTYIFCVDDKVSHDMISDSSGRNSIQFDNYFNNKKVSYLNYEDTLSVSAIKAAISKMNISDFSMYQTIGDYSFVNKNGDLIVNYVAKNIMVPSDGPIVDETYNSSVTVKNYFSKSLYSSIKWFVEYFSYNGSKYTFATDFANDMLGYKDTVISYEFNPNIGNKTKGSKFRDNIVGEWKNDTLSGGSGNDTISGGAGNDIIKGGKGDDSIISSYGNDKIYGESGVNTITYDTLIGGNDTIYSGKGSDHIDLSQLTRDDILITRAGKNLVLTYNQTKGSSITIANYFGKKGKTSVKDIKLAWNDELGRHDYVSLISEYSNILASAAKSEKINKSKSSIGESITTGIGYDTITTGKYNDTIVSGLGNDVIKAGSGNDIITGGLGSDKMYGQSGDNTYIIETISSGNDTIYTSGKGKTIVDFSATGIDFTNQGVVGAYNDGYSYTKSGNDLILNYASDLANYDTSSIRFSNFFKSKNTFTLKDGNGEELDLKNAIVYFDGTEEKKNKITGSSISDYILGKELNDSLKGGAGNDTLVGGLGKDTLVGGTGKNTIEHTKGDGNDVITLTKGENLKINLDGFKSGDLIAYSLVKKDFVISYINEDGTECNITLKNFGTKDVTNNATKKAENTSSVELYLNGVFLNDLRNDKVFEDYTAFTYKKYKYSGNWHTEYIDASAIDEDLTYNPKNRGASINAGAGNDTIIGTMYNDTIKGGNGDDVITAGTGTNKLDGNNGSDTYNVFVENPDYYLGEITTISDTGKGATDVDTVNLYASKDDIKIWFNIDKNGKATYKFNIEKGNDSSNKLTASGVEKIVANGNTKNNTADDLYYQYDNENLKNQVVAFLGTRYKDVNQVMNGNNVGDKLDLIAIFNDSQYWTNTP